MTKSEAACIVGVGESSYYRRGKSPYSAFRLATDAVLAACADAGIGLDEVDGLVSYIRERTTVEQLAGGMGIPRLRFANSWSGGGGGIAAVALNAAMAVRTGEADVVVCYRAICQGQQPRLGQIRSDGSATGPDAFLAPFGLITPAQRMAPKAMRYLFEHGLGLDDSAPVALASYWHAQHNPRALMHGRPLDLPTYLDSRWIVKPFRLYDCPLESDAAAAFVVVRESWARERGLRAVRIVGGIQGSDARHDGMGLPNEQAYATAGFGTIGPELYSKTGLGPDDIDVLQVYETFAPMVLAAVEELGFCAPGTAAELGARGEFLWPDGRLPLNTSGGNLAEAYVHGLELVVEAVRQLRGEANCQIEGARRSLVAGGPGTHLVSAMILEGVAA